MPGSSALETLERFLISRGGIARIRPLSRRRTRDLAEAVRRGRILRVRKGWYALPETHRSLVAAVRVGGATTAVTAAKAAGLWTVDDHRLHVAVPHDATRLRLPRDRRTVCLHWVPMEERGHLDAVTVPIAQALLDLAHCQPREQAVASIDSALNKGLVSLNELRAAFAGAPRRVQELLDWCDPGSQSGTESIVRVRLRSRGVGVRVQFRITGVGRVDLLIGDRLVIECDSREFHDKADSYASDRARDLELLRQGYLVIRLTYSQVMFHWDEVEPAILELVRSRAHRRPRRQKRAERYSG